MSKSGSMAMPVAAALPRVAPLVQPHVMLSTEQTPPYRQTISGFTRYSNSLQALPSVERAKIEALARYVLASHRQGNQPVRSIQIVGHADLDTPRRPGVELKMSQDRALRVRAALAAAIDRLSENASPRAGVLPPYSTRVQWDWSGAGAKHLAVPVPRDEADRARNRRVEITLTPVPRHEWTHAIVAAKISADPLQTWKAQLESAIQTFCSRIGTEEIDRSNCAAAVNRAAEILGASAPKQLKCNLAVGADFVDAKDYRSPFRVPPAALRCCTFNAPCDKEPYKSGCAHCAGGLGTYLVVRYHPRLADAVEKVRCVLDRGCLAVAGVLSGICDDKPDRGCAKKTPPTLIWKECPEHWLLIIGYADDPSGKGNYTFVFWDSARMSPLHICGHEFGLLYFNRAENWLTTFPTLKFADVDKDGFHPWPQVRPQDPEPFRHRFTQKRYQVLKLGASGPYREQTRAC